MNEFIHKATSASTTPFINALSLAIGTEQFRAWFGSLRCSLQGVDVIELELEDDDSIRRVQEMFGSELKQAIHLALGPQASLAWRSTTSSLKQTQPTPSNFPSGSTQIPNHWLGELRHRIGLSTWCVFETLFSFVCCGEIEPTIQQKHLKQGELVAYVPVKDIAQSLGLSTRRVRSNLRKLEKLGLVRTSSQPHGRANVYVLGRLEDGREQWFVDLALDSGFLVRT